MTYRGKWYFRAVNYAIIGLFLVVTMIPVHVVVSNSFRPTLQIREMPPRIIFTPTLSHFRGLLEYDNFLNYFRNSIVISVSVTCITLVLGSLAAYSLKLFKSRLGERLSNLLLLGKLAHSAMSLPFVIWLMAGFVRDLPDELLESARVEGATRMQTFSKIIFPMLTPAAASAVVLVMQASWNELMFSLQLTNVYTYPLTVGIARYVGAVSVDWGKSSVAATIAMVSIITVGFLMQRYLVTGMTAGAVKS